MGRVVAVSGGELSSTRLLNEYAIKMTGKEKPKVLFIGTASNDADGYIENIHINYEAMNCVVKELSLTKRTYTDIEIDQLLGEADLIYVGGGDTVFMLTIWKKYGVDQKLKQIYKKDLAVLTGVSAGAICWFCCGHSDSESFSGKGDWKYVLADGGLELYHAAFCPHYDEDGRDSFDQMLENTGLVGLALENNTAMVEDNGMFQFIKSEELAKAYKLDYHEGMLCKEELDVKMLK